jgi:hypothetical protein
MSLAPASGRSAAHQGSFRRFGLRAATAAIRAAATAAAAAPPQMPTSFLFCTFVHVERVCFKEYEAIYKPQTASKHEVALALTILKRQALHWRVKSFQRRLQTNSLNSARQKRDRENGAAEAD